VMATVMATVMAMAMAMAACGPAQSIEPTTPHTLAAHREVTIDKTPKERRRMVPPEVYLRAYLTWFGGLAPLEVQAKARGKALFDAWDDYLAALGLPDYRVDLPRATQSNTLMAATLGRLGEALCIRAAERDLRGKLPVEQRVVFAFVVDAKPPTHEQLLAHLDVLHRTFLGYPLELAPPGRADRLAQLWTEIAKHHQGKKGPLTADELAWAGVCTALVQHPEAELY